MVSLKLSAHLWSRDPDSAQFPEFLLLICWAIWQPHDSTGSVDGNMSSCGHRMTTGFAEIMRKKGKESSVINNYTIYKLQCSDTAKENSG